MDKSTLSPRVFFLGAWGLIVYFIIRAAYFGATIRFGMPPDEHTHAGLIFHIARTAGFWGLEGVPPVAAHIGTSYFLYHWLLGSGLYWADQIFSLDEETVWVSLRLTNTFFVAVTLLAIRDVAATVFGKGIRALLALLICSNVLMATFLAGAINYDNLTNMWAALAVWQMVRLGHIGSLESAIKFGAFLTLGCLTKASMLPLAGLLVIAVCWRMQQERTFSTLLSEVRNTKILSGKAFLLSGAVLLLLLTLTLWISNWTHYGAFFPTCAERLSHEICMKEDPVYRKYAALSEENSDRVSRIGEHRLDPVRYLAFWFDYMVEKSIGIFAYRSYYQLPLVLGLIELLFLAGFVSILWRIIVLRRSDAAERDCAQLFVVAIAYLIFLAYYGNYRYYLQSGLLVRYDFIGVQGRYAFIVLGALVIPIVHALSAWKPQALRNGVLLLIAFLMWFSDLPSFLLTDSRVRLRPNTHIQAEYVRATVATQTLTQR